MYFYNNKEPTFACGPFVGQGLEIALEAALKLPKKPYKFKGYLHCNLGL